MNRGEVWWAELPAPVNRRPVVLLSRDASFGVRTSTTVALITRTIRGIPVEVELTPNEGLPYHCVINADNLQTIPIGILGQRIATLNPVRLKEVETAVRFALGLD
ncbi:MAG: type II toxin-antitoxin system PemK/MazF family toxin [Candidatus Riflebacteria bacterium]|nr:type II toxin-antitoxin system PemK/MazF family toxin [Candidatus Riflebacteria bacterium]